jgi:hypothetical protein
MDKSFLQKFNLSGKIPRRVYGKFALYHGSEWWCLPIECIDYIINFLEKNSGYIFFHKWTLYSDEIFFTLSLRVLPLAKNIFHDYEKTSLLFDYSKPNEHGCTYIDWNAKDVHLPKVLDSEDFTNLVDSVSLFARKFDQVVSSDLMQQLELKRLCE